jgi:hypothetical protein
MRVVATIERNGLRLDITLEAPEGEVASQLAKVVGQVAGALDGHQVTKPTESTASAPSNGHGPGAANGNGNGGNGGHGASPKQKALILGLGAKLGLKLADVNARAKAMFGADATIHSITKAEASALIDELKATPTPKVE